MLSVSMLFSNLIVQAKEPGDEIVEMREESALDGGEEEREETIPEEADVSEEDVETETQPTVEPEFTPEPSEAEAASFEDAVAVPVESLAPEETVEEDELVGTQTFDGDLRISSGTTLTENWVVNGDLIVDLGVYRPNLNFEDFKIEVNGDMIIKAGYICVDTGILTVSGEYRQESGSLDIGSGRVDVGGDFRLQKIDAEGNYAPSNGGYLYMRGSSGRLNIDGDFVMETSHGSNECYSGTMTLKGDLLQLPVGKDDYFNGWASGGFKLIMAGTAPQKISMASVDSYLGNVQFDNPDITLEGCFGGKLLSNLNAKVIGDTITTGGLNLNGHNMILPANLTVQDTVNMNSGILTVQGDLTTNASIYTDGAGSQLVVTGNYRQESGSLDIGSGRVDVGGDFRLQKIDAEGNYAPSNGGYLYMRGSSGRLNIDGDFVMETSHGSNECYSGTMTLKGDLLQLPVGKDDYFNGWASGGFKLIMAGTAPQKISMASAGSTIGNLQLDNQDVTVEGCLNATLVSDGKIKTADGGTLKVSSWLSLNNHKLEVTGNMAASKEVSTGGTNGYLIVNGNYWQEAGELEVGKGRVDISGNLRIQALDADGDNTVGSGSVTMNDAGGRLNVGGDYVMQSNRDSTFRNGILSLKGNLFQLSSNGASGSFYTASANHKVILDGVGAQAIQFDNPKSRVGSLQLTLARSNYTFNPDPCWMKLLAWPFADVAAKEGNWKYDNIKYVYDKGIMTGVKETEFQPDVPLTRAMFASVIYRMADEPGVTYKRIFSDVPAGKWYSDAVIWAYENGIVAGLGDGRYGINDNITREQMARMLMEFARVQGYGTGERDDFSRFADASQVSRWATEYMRWAVGSGMISGSMKDGRYYMNPRGQATRAECATMLAQFIKKHE